jgi:hypothetical protein
MAHFAELDENNIVKQVIVVDNNSIDPNNEEESGILFLKSLFGEDTNWKQTSYNGNIKKNFAGVGYSYSEEHDAFIAPNFHTGWVFDATLCQWRPPYPAPTDGKAYYWDNNAEDWLLHPGNPL